jgi:hypothetical protein
LEKEFSEVHIPDAAPVPIASKLTPGTTSKRGVRRSLGTAYGSTNPAEEGGGLREARTS